MQVKMEPEVWNAAVDKAEKLIELWSGRVTRDFNFAEPKVEIEYRPKWPGLYSYDYEYRLIMKGCICTKRYSPDGEPYNFSMKPVYNFAIRRAERVCRDILSAGKVSDAKEIYLTEEQNHRYMALLDLSKDSFELHDKTLSELLEEGKQELEKYADRFMESLPKPEPEPEPEPEQKPDQQPVKARAKRSLVTLVAAAWVIVVIILQVFF